eukprot:COSAG06_NODE_151_length_21964_cov_95.963961_20_plen_118_part_00
MASSASPLLDPLDLDQGQRLQRLPVGWMRVVARFPQCFAAAAAAPQGAARQAAHGGSGEIVWVERQRQERKQQQVAACARARASGRAAEARRDDSRGEPAAVGARPAAGPATSATAG